MQPTIHLTCRSSRRADLVETVVVTEAKLYRILIVAFEWVFIQTRRSESKDLSAGFVPCFYG